MKVCLQMVYRIIKKLRCDATEINGLSVTVMTISKNSLSISETSSSGLALLWGPGSFLPLLSTKEVITLWLMAQKSHQYILVQIGNFKESL